MPLLLAHRRSQRPDKNRNEVEKSLNKQIVERLRAAMRERGIDAIVTSSPENFSYVAGFVVPSQPLIRHRHAMAVVTADGQLALFGVDMETTTIRKAAPHADLTVWGEFTDDPMLVLAELLQRLGLAKARIGMEYDYLPHGDFRRLAAALPQAALEPAESLLARLRQVKTQEEIALLRQLSRIADQSIHDAYASVRQGSTELDIAAALTRGVYTLGAEHFKLMIVATGERSELPNVGPTERRLAARDVCRVEIFAIRQGYHAGVCRTAVVQSAPPHAEDIWAKLTECKYLILDMIKPGASSREIYQAFSAKMASLGLPLISFVGHGIGLHLHEDPYLGPHADQPLEAGMVLGMEPLVYRTGHGYGMQNKDMVLVTETGCELLSDYRNTDRLIVVD